MAKTQVESPFTRKAVEFASTMDETAQIGLDYSVDSVQRLETFVAEHFDPPGSKQVDEWLIEGIGCYLGEVIIREKGGSWDEYNHPEIHHVGAIETIYPLEKARKRFEVGPGESLAFYYHSIARNEAIAAEAKAAERPDGLMGKIMGLFKKG